MLPWVLAAALGASLLWISPRASDSKDLAGTASALQSEAAAGREAVDELEAVLAEVEGEFGAAGDEEAALFSSIDGSRKRISALRRHLSHLEGQIGAERAAARVERASVSIPAPPPPGPLPPKPWQPPDICIKVVDPTTGEKECA